LESQLALASATTFHQFPPESLSLQLAGFAQQPLLAPGNQLALLSTASTSSVQTVLPVLQQPFQPTWVQPRLETSPPSRRPSQRSLQSWTNKQQLAQTPPTTSKRPIFLGPPSNDVNLAIFQMAFFLVLELPIKKQM
jgi:hypothetical protein